MFAFIFDSVSFSEWAVLLVVFLIVMGPRKIPQTARTLGNYYSKLRRAADSFKRQLLEIETEFNKATTEVENEVKEVEDAFSSEGDESGVIPSQDAYYPPETDEYGSPVSEPSSGADAVEETETVPGDVSAVEPPSDEVGTANVNADSALKVDSEPVDQSSKHS